MPIKLRLRLVPLVATAIVVAAGISLGQWQTRRAVEKEQIERKLSDREAAPAVELHGEMADVDALEYRRVIVRGEFDRDWPIYLENRPHNGVAGFHVLMPFQIEGSSRHVMVARGWAPRDAADRTKRPSYYTQAGVMQIEGIAVRHPGHVMQLGEPPVLTPNVILQNLDVGQFAASSRLTMQPFLLEQTTDTRDGLLRDWPRPSSGIERHRGYAFQWYGLAAAALIFFVVTGFRRGKK